MQCANSISAADERMQGNISHGNHQYGKKACYLYQCRSLLHPEIVRITGKASDYQSWACQQPCVVTLCNGTNPENRNELVLVRQRSSCYDKAYLGVPMCESVMAIYREHGLLVTLRYYKKTHGHETKESACAWIQQRAVELLHKWVWEVLKSKLGYQHWYDVPPELLQQWLAKRGLIYVLPRKYLQVDRHQNYV